MRTCCQCGALFTPTGNGYRCPPCRKEYDIAWRKQRRAEGKVASGTRMPREYHREYAKTYNQRPEVKERRNAQMRGYAKSEKTRDRRRARRAVRTAIEAGRMTREPCEVCAAMPTDAHHDDYSKPLAVRWLCRRHHVEHHAKAEGR